MRTTLDIDDEVLRVAKERARQANSTAGRVISELARRALTAPLESSAVREPEAVYGLRPLARRARSRTPTSWRWQSGTEVGS